MSSFEFSPLRVSLAFIAVVVAVLTNVSLDEEEDSLTIFKGKIAIKAPNKFVASFLSDLQSLPKWYPEILAVRISEANDERPFEDEMPLGPGKTYDEAVELPFIGRTMTKIVMTSYEPNAHVGFLLDRWWLPHVQLNMSGVKEKGGEESSSVEVIVSSRRNNLLFKFVGAPILRMVHSQTIRQGLFNLRFQINHQMLAVQKAQVPESAQKPIDQ